MHAGGSDGKESARNAGDRVQSLDREDSPGEENGNPLQYPCLENSMDRGATAHWVTKNPTQLKRLSTYHGKHFATFAFSFNK